MAYGLLFIRHPDLYPERQREEQLKILDYIEMRMSLRGHKLDVVCSKCEFEKAKTSALDFAIANGDVGDELQFLGTLGIPLIIYTPGNFHSRLLPDDSGSIHYISAPSPAAISSRSDIRFWNEVTTILRGAGFGITGNTGKVFRYGNLPLGEQDYHDNSKIDPDIIQTDVILITRNPSLEKSVDMRPRVEKILHERGARGISFADWQTFLELIEKGRLNIKNKIVICEDTLLDKDDSPMSISEHFRNPVLVGSKLIIIKTSPGIFRETPFETPHNGERRIVYFNGDEYFEAHLKKALWDFKCPASDKCYPIFHYGRMSNIEHLRLKGLEKRIPAAPLETRSGWSSVQTYNSAVAQSVLLGRGSIKRFNARMFDKVVIGTITARVKRGLVDPANIEVAMEELRIAAKNALENNQPLPDDFKYQPKGTAAKGVAGLRFLMAAGRRGLKT